MKMRVFVFLSFLTTERPRGGAAALQQSLIEKAETFLLTRTTAEKYGPADSCEIVTVEFASEKLPSQAEVARCAAKSAGRC